MTTGDQGSGPRVPGVRPGVVWVFVALTVTVVAVLAAVGWSVRTDGTPTQTAVPGSVPTSSTPVATGQPTSTAVVVPTAESSLPCSQDDPCVDVPPSVAAGSPVQVLVTSSGWDRQRGAAWVAADIGVLDSAGVCTVTLRKGSAEVVQEAPAEAGPMTTTCAVEVAGERLRAGEWLVSLSYLSEHHSGAAPDVSILVP